MPANFAHLTVTSDRCSNSRWPIGHAAFLKFFFIAFAILHRQRLMREDGNGFFCARAIRRAGEFDREISLTCGVAAWCLSQSRSIPFFKLFFAWTRLRSSFRPRKQFREVAENLVPLIRFQSGVGVFLRNATCLFPPFERAVTGFIGQDVA